MPLVALHDQLVRAADHVDVVGGVELGHHVAPKQVPSSSGTHAPPSGICGRAEGGGRRGGLTRFGILIVTPGDCCKDGRDTFGIGPQEVAHGSVVGHFLFSVNGSDLVQCLDGRRQAAVHAEDLQQKQRNASMTDHTPASTHLFPVGPAGGNTRKASHLAVNDGRERQVVEYLGAVSPHGDRAVLAETLVVETINLGDLPGLVVSPNQSYPVWVAHLKTATETREHPRTRSARVNVRLVLLTTII